MRSNPAAPPLTRRARLSVPFLLVLWLSLLAQLLPGPGMSSASAETTRGRAALLSLLVPGLGQYKLGDTRMAGIFGGAEAGALAALITFRREVGLRHDSQTLFAQTHARVNVGPADGGFERDVGAFLSSDEFNRSIVLFNAEALSLGETDPAKRVQLIQDYLTQNSYTGDHAWRWDSNEDRVQYLRLLKSRLNANRNGNVALGVVVANHLLSAADALRPRHAAGEKKLSLWNTVPSMSLRAGGSPQFTWSLEF